MVILLPAPRATTARELKIEAESFSVDSATNRYQYTDGTLTLGDWRIFATRVEVDAGAGTLVASGYVRLSTPDLLGSATRLTMHMQEEEGAAQMEGAALYHVRSGLFLRAERLEITPDGSLRAEDCRFTTCPPNAPGWDMRANSLELEDEGTAVAWSPTFRLEGVPVFWLPALAWPTGSQRRSGVLMPALEEHTSSAPRLDLGWRFRLPLFWAIGFDHDLTVTPEQIERRGTALGLEYNYAFFNGQRGQLRGWGLRERDARDPADEITPPLPGGAENPPTRYYLDFSHNEAFGAGGRLILGYAHSSDGQVRREYGREAVSRPHHSGQAGYTHQWGDLAGGLLVERRADYGTESLYATSWQDTDGPMRPALKPRAQLLGAWRPWDVLGLGLGMTGQAFERTGATGQVTETGSTSEARPLLALPIPLGDGLEWITALAWRTVRYEASQTPASGVSGTTEAAWAQSEHQMELRGNYGRVFGSLAPGGTAWKHRVTPRLIYATRSDVVQPYTGEVIAAQYAHRLLTLRLDNALLRRRAPLAAPAAGDGVAAGAAGDGVAAGAALGDAVETTEGMAPRVDEVLRLNLIQRFDLQQQPGTEPLVGPAVSRLMLESAPEESLLPFIMEGEAGSGAWRTAFEARYHHQRAKWSQGGASMAYRPSAYADFRLGYRYNDRAYMDGEGRLLPRENVATSSGEAPLFESLSMGFEARYNLTMDPPPLNRPLERAAAFVDFHPACYQVRLGYEEEVETLNTAAGAEYTLNRSVKITFNLSGLIGGAPVATTGQGAQ